MMEELSDRGVKICGDVYAYDQMNYVLAQKDDDYVARYIVRVEKHGS